jgi:tetratricopeptide (TPR) repeat protein
MISGISMNFRGMGYRARALTAPEWALRLAAVLRPALFASFVVLASCSGSGERSGASGTAPPPQAPAEVHRRLLIVGLDAADLRLIERGIGSGSLPNFARMIAEGASGPLRTHQPMLSPILWTTMATGLTPDRHGVLDFVETDDRGRTVPVTSRARRAPAFWEILGDRGVSCAIVGWLATYPATPVKGLLVTDRFTIHPYEEAGGPSIVPTAGKTWPADLDASLRPLVVEPSSLSGPDLAAAFGVPPHLPEADARERRELSVIEAVARTYTSVALRLDAQKPDCLAVYYEALDRLMHLFGSVMPPALPGTPEAKARHYGGAVDRFYAAMDARLGEFLRAAGEDGTVLVVSDHGFKIGDERPRHEALRSDVFAAEWHKDPGVILAWGKGVRRGVRIANADIYDIAPTVLAFFGAPAAETMRGRALTDLFEPGALPTAPPRVPSYEKPGAGAPSAQGGTEGGRSADAENAEILDNLRALGYVGGAADAEARSASNLATFYLEEKQYDRAIALYERAIAKDPKDLTALYNLGYAYKGRGANARAAESFERLLAARPDYIEARLVLSDVYVSLGRAGDALALLQARAADGRADPGWHNHLGTVLASLGRSEEAAAAFERSIALRPGEASPYLNLARVLLARGDRAGAAAVLARAQAAAPGDPRVAARLAELHGASAVRR